MLKCLQVLLLFCCVWANVWAGEKVVFAPAPSWLVAVQTDLQKKPNNKDVSGGYYLQLLDRQINLGSAATYRHVVRQITNTTGVQEASEVSVTFAPQYETLQFHSIRLLRNGQEVSHVNPTQIKVVQEETDAADYQYNGRKRAYVLLEDVRKGDQIDFSYTLQGFNPVFAGKWDDCNYLTIQTAICNYFYTVIVPPSRELQIKYFNNAPKPVISNQPSGDKVYRWSNPAMELYDYTNGTPSWYIPYPYFWMSEYRNWNEVVNWGLDIFGHYQQPLPAALLAKIADWSKTSGDSTEEFITLAIRFVQDQVRYQGLEIGQNTHRPYSPEQVFQRRYGDCKDKALLLARILQQKGIEAYVALVNTDLRNGLKDVQPSAGAFNHAVTVVKMDGRYKFIDPTISYQRGSATQMYTPAYGQALLIKEKETGLTAITPGLVTATINETFTISLKGKGESELKAVSVYKGKMADQMREQMAGVARTDLEKGYLEYYENTYPGIVWKDGLEETDDSVENIFTVQEHYTIDDIWEKTEDSVDAFPVFARPIYDRLPNPKGLKAGMPLALPFPLSLDYTITLFMPEDWPLEAKSASFVTDAYRFSFRPETKDGQVYLRYEFTTFKDHIAAEDVAAYKKAYQEMVSLMEFEFSRDGNIVAKVNEAQEKGAGFNLWMLLAFLVLAGGGVAGLFRLNRLSAEVEYEAESGWPIGGWTLVLGISLCLGMLVNVVSFLNSNYFSKSWWLVSMAAGKPVLGWIIMLEFVLDIAVIVFLAGILFWFFNRRDIFPKMFRIYVFTLFGANLLLVICYYASGESSIIEASGNIVTQLFRTMIYGAIWLSYIHQSSRVRATFLRSYNGRPVQVSLPQDDWKSDQPYDDFKQ